MLKQSIQQALVRRYAKTTKSAAMIKKAFDSRLVENLQVQFEGEAEVYSASIFVDIAEFTAKIDGWPVRKVRALLDSYYSVAIPIITEQGGLIDRIAGDGIVAVFSQFFHASTSATRLERDALFAAERIVRGLKDTRATSKAAVSVGDLLFCETGLAGIYQEYTVVGAPLAELYRLEGIAEANQVVLCADTSLGDHVLKQVKKPKAAGSTTAWMIDEVLEPLRGLYANEPQSLLIEKCVA